MSCRASVLPWKQAREARNVASQLADEQPGACMFAFGVGRGVDRSELLHIAEVAPPRGSAKLKPPEERYMDLFYKEEAPW